LTIDPLGPGFKGYKDTLESPIKGCENGQTIWQRSESVSDLDPVDPELTVILDPVPYPDPYYFIKGSKIFPKIVIYFIIFNDLQNFNFKTFLSTARKMSR
jgi:hypothetical protein